MTPAPQSRIGPFLRGFGIVMLCHLGITLISLLFALLAIGLLQLAYVIPMALSARKLGQTARLQGILTAAGLTILLNGTCYVALFSSLSGPHR